MASQWRPLTALSDDELDDRLRRKADHVDWSYQNVLDEMNRRSADRSARWSLRLAWIVAIATIVNAFAAIAAAWAAIVVAQRPGS